MKYKMKYKMCDKWFLFHKHYTYAHVNQDIGLGNHTLEAQHIPQKKLQSLKWQVDNNK